jgi:RNA polymerase sigma factor (sigma-70 family)
MQNANSLNPNDFEFTVFESISESSEINSSPFNSRLNNLLVKYSEMASKLARKFHLDEDLAQDILQDGMVLLITRIREGRFEFNPEMGFAGFLYRAFTYLAANQHKKYQRFLPEEYGEAIDFASEELDFDNSKNPIIPEGALEEKVQELIHEKMGEKAAQVLEICLIKQKTNDEGARMMKYRDESIFRKKKSQHLKTFRERITVQQEKELLRMAS